jgi:hypothetical protein
MDRNEERQLRLGLGQLLRYRYGLRRDGVKVHAYLVCERKPCHSAGRLVPKGDRAYQAPRFISALSPGRAILARSRPSTKGPRRAGHEELTQPCSGEIHS